MSKKVIIQKKELVGEIKNHEALQIVAIGASAGGLEAITELLQNITPNTGLVFIYIPHLSPDHKSLLTSLLAKATTMKVQEVTDKILMKPNNFYIIPPDKEITVLDGRVQLTARAKKRVVHLPIDTFFSSLAEIHKEDSIGVVLSGSANDGTRGLLAIKAAGRLTFAQNNSAKFTNMPQSAMTAGAVDYALSPKDIATELIRISKSNFSIRNAAKRGENKFEDADPAQHSIKESDQRFEIAVAAVKGIVWTNNSRGEMEGEQKSWAALTGQSFEEYQGYGWSKAVHPDDVQPTMHAWHKAVAASANFIFEHRVKLQNGQWGYFSINAVPIFNAEGSIKQWIGVHIDITLQKIAEEKIKNFAKELEKKVHDRTIKLAIANEKLMENNLSLQIINKELQSFSYVASHDLQEPLRKIQTLASRIIESEAALSDKGKDYFDRMQKAAERMQALIQDLLSYSSVQNSKGRKLIKTDLNIIIEEVKTQLSEIIIEKKAIVIAAPLCDINIIPYQFRQVMLNLISNALKFSKPDKAPVITIKSNKVKYNKTNNATLPRLKEYCHISVADNGIGFEAAYNDKIFEIFQRLHDKDDYPGTGIGLAIVKKIIENHNGIITAKGKLGKGAIFEMYIPA